MTPSNDKLQSAPVGVADFRTTHWSVVLTAGESSARSTGALETLCRTYWYPLYAYIRRKGHSPHDAQDLAQGFFARLLKNKSFAGADREKGKFRTYLLGALNHFLADEWDKARAEKRGGGDAILSLDDENAERRYLQEPSADLTPEKIFDRHDAARPGAETVARRIYGRKQGPPFRVAQIVSHLRSGGGRV